MRDLADDDAQVDTMHPYEEALERLSEGLIDEAQPTLHTIVVPLAARFRTREIGAALGLRPGEAERWLARLRAELGAACD
jgi:hypothetical protein